MMEKCPDVILIGQGVKSPWYVGRTADRLLETYGDSRVIDTPVSENAVTGTAVGAAITGLRPVVVHPRMDFMSYALDPIMNESANWRYMSNGSSVCPVVFWGIINRGGEQGAQHSQALHSLYAHIPGLKVVAPSNPYDAKGLMIAAVEDDNPVVFVDDRFLYEVNGIVPEESYRVPIGKGNICRNGTQISIISLSYATHLAQQAAVNLDKNGIDVEIVDIRSVKPLDIEIIVSSVKKTGLAIVLDIGWHSFGASAEISAVIHEQCFKSLRHPVSRLALPDVPAPSARTLESAYYYSASDIEKRVMDLLSKANN
ncbi:pyruvate dehydrogenase subunit beta [Planctomycetales bacterium]|nr:pyruvate dehydrogenase subunit beta [Planctomycetales bacterium]